MTIPVEPEQIHLLAPQAKDIYVKAFAKADEILGRYDINANARRISNFMGQVMHESGALRVITESMDYSYVALIQEFSRTRISAVDARQYGRTPEHPADQPAIANILYGGNFGRINLGNTKPGDGWKFRGHYLLQHTGHDFFSRMAAKLGTDIEVLVDPSRIDPPMILTLACEEWTEKGCNVLADADNIDAITKRINGAFKGLGARKAWRERTREVWK